MASKASAAIALLLSLKLLFFSMATLSEIVALTQRPNYDVNVCINVLGLLGGGLTPGCSCCTFIANLITADAEVCLCAIVNANILGLVNVDATLHLELLFNDCGLHPSKTYNC